MPPKKAAAQEKKTLLGRPGNNLKVGIVGVPNVGKSSFFNALSETDLGKAANFPYATINPEEARIPVPDARFEWLCDTYKPASRVPAFLTCIDIAGLTAGASTGAGLGNSFLSHVRAVDGIFQVIRAFNDAEVIHVEGDVNPVRDMEIIQTELRLKDIEWVEKALENLKRAGRALNSTSLADKAKKEEIATVEKVLKVLTEDNKDVRKAEWNNKEVIIFSQFVQPAFLSEVVCKSDPTLAASLFLRLVEMGVTPHNISENNRLSDPPLLCSDFEKKFVCGEIMSYEDLKEYGSEASVKAAGKLRQQGKPYESASSYPSASRGILLY
ncbi:hypothetical protein C0991_012565 [Blastosporella zonata]|nr:hypothetical protein C0991_012565 [Blastosporella zonata]